MRLCLGHIDTRHSSAPVTEALREWMPVGSAGVMPCRIVAGLTACCLLGRAQVTGSQRPGRSREGKYTTRVPCLPPSYQVVVGYGTTPRW